jgi:ornithine--oxo-acid transaminase
MLLRCGRASSGLSLALRAPASPFGTLSEALIKREKRSAAQTYHPLPVVWTRAKGCSVWDVEGNEYLDFLASYRCVVRSAQARAAQQC